MSLELQNISKIYGTQTVVNKATFSIKKGEIVGFLGPNGAGKSTTMKILSCYIPPTSGTAKVSGFEVQESPIEVRKKIGYLPEHNPLYLDMYVKEYLQFVAKLHKINGSVAKRIKEMIETTGLEIEQNKKIGQLSKGYRQRVGLASALIHQPEVLILDEPTTGLDPNQLEGIRSLIKELGKEKTLMFSSHIMQEVQAVCDRVIIINRGKIVADNSTSELEALNAGSASYKIEFLKADESLKTDLLKIEAVNQIKFLGKNTFEIKSKKDPRAEIFNFAVQKNLVLIGLEKRTENLEDIFKNLTK